MYKILSPETVTVAEGAVIEDGVVIHSGNVIGGSVILRRGAVLYPNNIVENSYIGAGAQVTASVLRGAHVGEGAQVGPFANLRQGAVVGENCRIGDFVELKNSTIGEGTKISHLTYVGDADVGRKVNFGCGTVLVNYDGNRKYRSTIGDHCFIGCNTNLVSPVHIGDGAYTAAGSTITQDVEPDALAIARARQVAKPGWAAAHRAKKDAK